ncbi:MAG: carboxypeptidase-like regulatory domain-containing protein [Bacteroidales bacterium]|nr:carboxypeptidase-like regulatory domain-containing protein [Bacteroidales bacterium]
MIGLWFMSGTRIIFLQLLLIVSHCMSAQNTVVSGKVLDDATGDPVPYTNIGFQHSTVGTISETDGSFYLSTTKATDTLFVSSLGYEIKRLPIKVGEAQEFIIRLAPVSIDIEAVVVRPGENPAFRILRKINEFKKQNDPTRIELYQYKAYTKLRLDLNNIGPNLKDRRFLKEFNFVFNYMDSSELFNKNYLPLLITESMSSVYYAKNPPVRREVIEAFNVSGIENKTVSQYAGKMYQQLNIYDNFILFFDPGFVSPIADFGRMYYKYYLEDSAFIDTHWCYKISFKPKRKQERTFHGFFWVADTSFAIKNIQLRVSTDVNLNLLRDMIATLEFDKVNDTLWFLTREDMVIDFNVIEKSYGFFGRKTAVYDSIIFDRPVPESVKQMTTDTYISETDISREDSYWENNRKSKMSLEDLEVFEMVDSVKNVPAYKFIYGLANMLVDYYIVTGPVELGPYYTTVSGNPVEGLRLRLGGRTSNAFSTKIMPGGHVAYGFRDNRFKYGLYLMFMVNTNPRRTAYGSYLHDIRQLGKSENAFLDDNYMTSIIRRNPNFKLTMVDQYSFYYEHEWAQGFSNTLRFKHQKIHSTSYIPFEYFTVAGDTLSRTTLTSAEFTLSTHWAYREKFLWGKFERISLGSLYPTLDLDLTYGPKDLFGSEYEYWKIRLRISDKVETNPLGFLKFRLTAGKVFGTLPYPLLKLHEGNETYVYDPLSFNMMNYYEFVSDEYVSLFAEQHFQGFFLNRIPLIRRLHWREVLSCNILFGHLSEKNRNLMIFPEGLSSLSQPYYEAGVGIENIFRLFRVDALWRFSYLDHPDVSRFGIRATMQLSF